MSEEGLTGGLPRLLYTTGGSRSICVHAILSCVHITSEGLQAVTIDCRTVAFAAMFFQQMGLREWEGIIPSGLTITASGVTTIVFVNGWRWVAREASGLVYRLIMYLM